MAKSSLLAKCATTGTVTVFVLVANAAGLGVGTASEIDSQVTKPKNEVATAETQLRDTKLIAEARESECIAKVAIAELNLGIAKLSYKKFSDSEVGEYQISLHAVNGENEVAVKQLSIAKSRLARLKDQDEVEPHELEQAELEVVKASATQRLIEVRQKHLRTYGQERLRLQVELALKSSEYELANAIRVLKITLAQNAREVGANERLVESERENLTKANADLD